MSDLTTLLTAPLTFQPAAPVRVPNIIRPVPIAILGEAPGHDEVGAGEPFVGYSGTFLFNVLGRCGIRRQDVSILNLCEYHPPGNRLESFDWDGPEFSGGRNAVSALLSTPTTRPNLLVLLGNAPLHYALEGNVPPRRTARGFAWPNAISNWRGSVFWSKPLGIKCLATLHPAHVLRNYATAPLFQFDLTKIRAAAASPHYVPWVRDYPTAAPLDYYLTRLRDIVSRRLPTAYDIEGGIHSVSCIGFATSATDAFTVPFIAPDGRRYWLPHEEAQLWDAIRAVLTDPNVPKIAQNNSYDSLVLAYSYGLVVRGLIDDTMLKARALFAELRTGLGTLTSIYTDHHFYKEEREAESWSDQLRYNATDCAVTYEVNFAQSNLLAANPSKDRHYRFMMSLLPATLYMMLKGFRVDFARRNAAITAATEERDRLQYLLDQLRPLPTGQETEFIRQTICHKRCSDWSLVRADYLAQADEIRALAERWSTLTPTQRGRLRTLTKTGLNTSSTASNGDIAVLLYDRLKLPMPIDHGRPTRSTDVGTLLTLMMRAGVTDAQRTILFIILRHRAVTKFLQLLQAPTEPDGRWHFMLNLAGTETGRPSGYKFPTGTGLNPLTAPKHGRLGKLFRPVIMADDGHWFFEVDLSGADGWTVAAHCAALGDRTMMDDYLNGIKPYAVIALMYLRGAEVNRLSRAELKAAIAAAHLPEWLKFACKRVQHGTNYGLKEQTGCTQILKDSWKLLGTPIYVAPSVFGRLQALYRLRYVGLSGWHAQSANQLQTTATLTTASGSVRHFFGRRRDDDTLRKWLAHEPQANTAYATYLPLHRLWYDPENRTSDDHLIIRPQLMFYDALLGQFPRDRTDWAVAKLREYFNNTITVARQQVHITYEGHYGPSWGVTVGEI